MKGLWVDLQLVRRGRAGKGRWKQPGVGGCTTPPPLPNNVPPRH